MRVPSKARPGPRISRALIAWAVVAPSAILPPALLAGGAAGAAGSPNGAPGPAIGSAVRLPPSPMSAGALAARAWQGRASSSAPSGSRGVTEASGRALRLHNVQASEGGQPVNEVPIVVNPANHKKLLTGGNDYNCPSIQGFYASGNGGLAWNHTCMPLLPGQGGCGDPIVGYDLTGAAYAGGIDCTGAGTLQGEIALMRSTSNGTTWGPPVNAVPAYFPGGFPDKPWLEVDDNPSSPHKNAVYISTTQFDASGFNTQITVSHSTDGGNTFSLATVDLPQIFPEINQFSDLAVGRDGTVYLSYMHCTGASASGEGCAGGPATMMFSKSTDGGATWTSPVAILQVALAPNACGCAFYGSLPNTAERVSDIPAVAVDNSKKATAGHLYVTAYTWTGQYMHVEVVRSSDGGVTWSQSAFPAPASDTHDQFFPWINVSSAGKVGVTWLDRRNDPQNLRYEAFSSLSGNGGATFQTNKKLSTVASNPVNDGFGGGFMGDYTGNAFAGATLYMVWADTRSGVNAQDEVGWYSLR